MLDHPADLINNLFHRARAIYMPGPLTRGRVAIVYEGGAVIHMQLPVFFKLMRAPAAISAQEEAV